VKVNETTIALTFLIMILLVAGTGVAQAIYLSLLSACVQFFFCPVLTFTIGDGAIGSRCSHSW